MCIKFFKSIYFLVGMMYNETVSVVITARNDFSEEITMLDNKEPKVTENNGSSNAASDGRKTLVFEFLRYAVVGGVSFVADTGAMTAVKEIFFKENCTALQMGICVAVGFVVGLICNYILSNLFVFKSKEQREKGKTLSAFLIYVAVGAVGFGLTELGMWAGVKIVGPDGLWYILVKCFVAGVVMIWNYVGRKIFVYRGK